MKTKTEEWRLSPTTGNVYEVSSFGRVRHAARKYVRICHLTHKGYPSLRFGPRGQMRSVVVHALVAEAFIGPRPEGLHINHIDGNKENNRPENLEYVTPGDNARHAFRLGLKKPLRGEANPKAKITADDVRAIRQARAEGVTLVALAERYGLTHNAISHIELRKNWKWVD